ncbi:hypothetical protein DFH06DRAFT_1295353 [Mycena polygramma]|nr:hypothetical protein DFH06DRAFT_1295353 [Mycena polygramma]
MTATVPLSALATTIEDIDAPFTLMQYLWGLDIQTIDPTHERSFLEVRKSMESEAPLRSGTGWTLVPTEETLAAMDALQVHNFPVLVSERKSFFDEFSATTYEYIFVPLYTEVDFFILEAGRPPQRFSAPYADFLRVTSTTNPFFVAFYSRRKVLRQNTLLSETWHRVFGDLKLCWVDSVLPEEFLLSCYPATLDTLSDHDSESETELRPGELESKFGSDAMVVTFADESASCVYDKEEFVLQWVQRNARILHKHFALLPPAPPAHRGRKGRKSSPSIPVGKQIRSEGWILITDHDSVAFSFPPDILFRDEINAIGEKASSVDGPDS